MTTPTSHPGLPREGMMATVRNRRALITRVSRHGKHDPLHLVEVAYTDVDGGRAEDTVLWEREVGARLVEPGALPDVHVEPPMPAAHFDALVRASRWSALTPFLPADAADPAHAPMPLTAPFHGAVQVEDFQLEPLLRALEMPRISLLLADDVGLGKTIEAGLVLTELILRRRIRRVLIMTPASLRDQWQQEMHDKFSLSFDLVDRAETHALQRRLGLDANPWRTFPRIITSYHYLRQPDVLQQFLATCQARSDAAQLPWDLLIVDEAHNLMPAPFGDDSDLTHMLRTVSPLFEHKLFLTATPHNGHTRSFSGLLELLDPVRFTQTASFTDAEKARVEHVVVRRLKRQINELDDERGQPRRFAERQLAPLSLAFGPREQALAAAFAAFRQAVKATVARARGSDSMAGAFAVEILQKRLLSAPATLADSWHRFLDGMSEDEPAAPAEVAATRRASEEDIPDDREREDRGRLAARTAGAWLRPLAGALATEIAAVTRALDALGLARPASPDLTTDAPAPAPHEDARFDALCQLIDKHLRTGRGARARWRDDERLIVFTEYKTTLDHLEARLRARYAPDDDAGQAIRVLYGGMDPRQRRAIKDAFNDPADPVRVLIATDAASEGLNLQETARLLLHHEIPWNPSRLEQRNGRLDRHGQARDVTVFHFTSDDDADLRFLGRVVEKVHQIREDLGTVGEIFDAAFERRFLDLEDADRVADDLDRTVDAERDASAVPARVSPVDEHRLRALRRDLDLAPDPLRATLEVALGLDVGPPRLEGPDARGRFRLCQPIPQRWRPLVDDAVRLPADAGALAGALPGLIFDPALFLEDLQGRPVFRPRRDTALLHLGHPLLRHALATFARLRFPGSHEHVTASRWTVRRGIVPAGAEALILLSVEELAVNELREPFHHWVRTLRVPVVSGDLAPLAPYQPPADDIGPELAARPADHDRARDLWNQLAPDLRDLVRAHARAIEDRIAQALAAGRDQAMADARDALQARIAEVKKSIRSTTLDKLRREAEDLRGRLAQRALFATDQRAREQRLADLDEELARREQRGQELLDLLTREKDRVLQRLLPRRFSLRDGGVQVFPLTVEIRLPAGDAP
jgi:superfamily II DNA or RNA helicase